MTTAAVRAAARAGTVTPSLVAAAAERMSAPSVVVQDTLAALEDGRASMRQIAERVGRSPELAAQVMRLGSSAIHGSAAGTLDQALVRIGTANLRALLLATSTYSLLAGSLRVYGLPAMALVSRAKDVAGAAQLVAEHSDPALGPQAHVAGLIADLGMPILAAVAEEAGIVVEPPLVGVARERTLFGTDHVRVGEWVARRWGLAAEIAEAIGAHHDPAPPESAVAGAVWVGDLVVRAREGDAGVLDRLAAAAEARALDPSQLEALLLGDDMGPPPGRPPDLTDREFEVLRLLADGLAPKQAAMRLGCSASTVHNHLHHVYRKLGVGGQAHALLLARERGWV